MFVIRPSFLSENRNKKNVREIEILVLVREITEKTITSVDRIKRGNSNPELVVEIVDLNVNPFDRVIAKDLFKLFLRNSSRYVRDFHSALQ